MAVSKHFFKVLLLISVYFTTCQCYTVNATQEEPLNLPKGNGKYLYTPQLAKIIAEEEATWHWLPWHHVRTVVVDEYLDVAKCSDNGNDFPDDLFTEEQLLQGAIILHFIAIIYCFSLLAVLCDDFFIPAVECICEDLGISKDVAAATFMASATSCPELFVNVMGTFVTQSDLGIGTIAGSALFNTLGVAAIGSFAAIRPIPIQRWPVTRDSIVYIFNVIVLVVMVWDDKIMWWETIILLILYVTYFVIMFNSKRMYNCAQKTCSKDDLDDTIVENGSENSPGIDNPTFEMSESARDAKAIEAGSIENTVEIHAEIENVDQSIDEPPPGLCSFPRDESILMKLKYLYFWPIRCLLTFVIPPPRFFRFMYPLTFLMCIIMIGVNSYFVSWMITTIGSTFGIPDSIMGMTFLAFGGCLPETFSIYVVTRKGKGDMGVSNSLGANSLAILFSLSIPWFIKCMILRSQGEEGSIDIQSGGMNYIIISIIFAVIALYIILTISKFTLMKKTGAATILTYVVFVVFAILMESGVFFDIGLESC